MHHDHLLMILMPFGIPSLSSGMILRVPNIFQIKKCINLDSLDSLSYVRVPRLEEDAMVQHIAEGVEPGAMIRRSPRTVRHHPRMRVFVLRIHGCFGRTVRLAQFFTWADTRLRMASDGKSHAIDVSHIPTYTYT